MRGCVISVSVRALSEEGREREGEHVSIHELGVPLSFLASQVLVYLLCSLACRPSFGAPAIPLSASKLTMVYMGVTKGCDYRVCSLLSYPTYYSLHEGCGYRVCSLLSYPTYYSLHEGCDYRVCSLLSYSTYLVGSN